MAFAYKTWASSWGTSWAGSWGAAAVVVTTDDGSGGVTRATKRLLKTRRSRDELTEALALLKVEVSRQVLAARSIPATPEAMLKPTAEVQRDFAEDARFAEIMAIERSLEKSRSRETLSKINRRLRKLEDDLDDERDFMEFIEVIH